MAENQKAFSVGRNRCWAAAVPMKERFGISGAIPAHHLVRCHLGPIEGVALPERAFRIERVPAFGAHQPSPKDQHCRQSSHPGARRPMAMSASAIAAVIAAKISVMACEPMAGISQKVVAQTPKMFPQVEIP